MDSSVTFAPKSVAAAPYVPNKEPTRDTKVPIVEKMEGAATIPTNKPFVAQVVSARLSGTEFPEQPGEIAPDERTLRPYSTPMLPSDGNAEAEMAAAPDAENDAKTQDPAQPVNTDA
ncbi:hypothetical protein [Yoonia sp. BS5-3]|uniref:Mu-like prophage FluMu N-terminal domain-containing protein n=1 Tax=Yoonia phaeophyticola TaxID=3137369 RepID=A0ABZ2V2H5_9RHOB